MAWKAHPDARLFRGSLRKRCSAGTFCAKARCRDEAALGSGRRRRRRRRQCGRKGLGRDAGLAAGLGQGGGWWGGEAQRESSTEEGSRTI